MSVRRPVRYDVLGVIDLVTGFLYFINEPGLSVYANAESRLS